MAVARTVLGRKGLVQPQNGTDWSADGDANWALLDANVVFTSDLAAEAFKCSAGSGLTLNIGAGLLLAGGTLSSYAGGTLAMTASATNYVYLDPGASFAPAANTTGFATGVVPLATVACGSSAITTVTDKRPGMIVAYGAVAANKVIAGPASGSDALAAARSLVAADLPVMVGDSGTGGTKGAVPAPGAGDAALGKFLKADGTFAVPGSGGVNAQTGTTYTLASSDNKKLVTLSNASAVAVTLPDASTLGASFACALENLGAGEVTLTPATGTIDGAASLAIYTGQGLFLYSDGTNWFTMRGNAGSSGVPTFVDGVTPSGSEGTSFNLDDGAPSPVASLRLFWDGSLKKNGVDYSLSGTTITTYTTVNPVASNMQAWYRK